MPGETLEKPIEKWDECRHGWSGCGCSKGRSPRSSCTRSRITTNFTHPGSPFETIPKPKFWPLTFRWPATGKSRAGSFHKAMSNRPACYLAVYILTLSLKPEGLVTPMRHPRVNVSDCLEVLAMTEMSSPNKTNELMRRDESLQVPGGRGSGSALLLKQPLCRQALKLQGWCFF